MSDLDTIAKLLLEIETLKAHLGQMKRHHLQVMTIITYALGGEFRMTAYDYQNLPVGATLSIATDPATGDTLFRVEVPESHEDVPSPHQPHLV